MGGVNIMGFENVETDGLSINHLKEETKQILTDFFGDISFVDSKKGQYEIFKDAEDKFENQLWNEFVSYFRKFSQKWDIVDDTARADNRIYVKFNRERKFIKFSNGKIDMLYSYEIDSDFKENPHYMSDKNARDWSRYRHKRVAPNDAKRLLEELNDIKEVLEFNKSLNGNYNFVIRVDKDANNTNRYVSEIEYFKYKTISELLDEISNEYF